MMIKKVRDKLIQIPWISELGTLRRKLFSCKWNLQSADLSAIREKYAKGENTSEETFFIVHESHSGGIFVYLIGCMTQIAYARKSGYVPVVDLLNFPNALKNEAQKDVNAWELYFEQPVGVGVEEVYGAKRVIFHGEETCSLLYIGDIDPERNYEEFAVVIDENKEFKDWYLNSSLMSEFRDFWRINIRYNDRTKEYIEERYQQLFPSTGKVLGVLCRGTDYISLRPRGHYVQPTVGMIIDKIEEVIEKYDYKYIFCATEDAEIYRRLKKTFAGEINLFGLDVERVRYKEGYLLNDLYKKQSMDIFQRQLNYLTEMELLSRCQGLIAGKTTGSRFLPVMKEGEYEYLYYWELGRYE